MYIQQLSRYVTNYACFFQGQMQKITVIYLVLFMKGNRKWRVSHVFNFIRTRNNIVAVGECCRNRRPSTDIKSRGLENKRNSDVPLGYSGRTALKREKCGVFAPCKNCGSTETSKHARNNKITSVYSSFLGDGQRPNEIT
jgi:hypothetical protein